ncbi:MAG: DEAD/DEAH box helicase [Candidatus Methanomethylophilaceae archaeon]|jgi:ATP-dependent RNA helicase DeaD|nr:DEAD/DEAH box helicase [Candidatus Methanomethylophilaceae archaeon]NLF34045.1 DEAD/DEAH box helicase [Thermoplasmatales archaeon]
MTLFSDLGVQENIAKAMKEMGWTEPTPVQEATIPVGLLGKDLFAQAQTGTGKTGTYGSIVLGRTAPGSKIPSALVLAPTRELALQVSEELGKLSKYTGHVCIPIYGGVSLSVQAGKLGRGADTVVGTPGRIRDLIDRGDLNLSKVSMVVLDEADRMLDMGFARDLNYILSKVPRKRQTMLFSATMSPDIRELAMKQMVKPEELLVSKDEIVLDLTRQHYLMADKDSKRDALCTLLDRESPKTIVFCHTKRRTNQLSKKMAAAGYVCGAIHGDVAQNKREKVVKSFRDGDIDVLIATDVAARGLDIDDVDCVVNYDMPDGPDTYVHRIGRTGRAGKEGMAVTFVTEEEKGELKSIERKTGKSIIPLEMEIVRRPEPEVPKKAAPAGKPAAGARKKEGSGKGRSASSAPSGFARRQTPERRTAMIEICLGSSDGLSRSDVRDFVLTGADLSDRDIVDVTLNPRTSIVEVDGKKADEVCNALSKYDYCDRAVRARIV